MTKKETNKGDLENCDLNFDGYYAYKSGYDSLFNREDTNSEEILIATQNESKLNILIRIMDALEIPFKTELELKRSLNPKALRALDKMSKRKITDFKKTRQYKTEPWFAAKKQVGKIVGFPQNYGKLLILIRILNVLEISFLKSSEMESINQIR